VVPNEFELNEFSVDVSSSGVIPLVFFDSGSDDIADEYQKMIEKLSMHLLANPDIILKCKGFYSRQFDNVLSNEESIAIAEKRAENVINTFLKFAPSLVNRIKRE
jgi:outer membrane protein OmpA-like peptidoglycan-associated protein